MTALRLSSEVPTYYRMLLPVLATQGGVYYLLLFICRVP